MHRRLARARKRRPELAGRLDDFPFDPEPLGDVGHVHVGIAEIVVHELALLHHFSSGRLLDDAAVRSAVGVVVVDHRDHGQLQARHVPQRRRPENERAVADQADHLLVRSRELDPRGGADPRPQVRAVIEEELAPADRVEVEAVQDHRPGFVHDDRVLVGELGDLRGHAVGEHRIAVPLRVFCDEGAQRLRLFAEAPDFLRALFGSSSRCPCSSCRCACR